MADFLVRWLSRTKEMDHDKDWKRIVNIDEEYSVSEYRTLNKDASHSRRPLSPLKGNDLDQSDYNMFVSFSEE